MSRAAWALGLPLAAQALATLADEVHFHRRRGLEKWERIGHPLDTLTVLACVGWVLLVPPTPRAIEGYLALAAISCVFITKDELVHAGRCRGGEHWLHAILFVLHPLALASIGLLWLALSVETSALPVWLREVPADILLTVHFTAAATFCLYQALYWNVPWLRPPPVR